MIAELDEVSKRYGARVVVDRVTLSLAAGERVALLGHNGAGKTTLMKLLLGLGRPSGGRVRVMGADPAARATWRARRGVGFLPENVAFDAAMTGRELLAFFARLKRRPSTECGELLDRVGLAAAADRRLATYSKGMRQRLGLAQALLGEPRLLLLDEPTGGLDPVLRVSFYDALRQLSGTGTAVLLSSHALTELEERTDRIAILREGRLLATGPLDELRRRAGLPVRVRLRVAAAHRPEALRRLGHRGGRPEGDAGIVLDCPVQEKMAALREVAALGPWVEDLHIDPPTLDDVYAHFVGAVP